MHEFSASVATACVRTQKASIYTQSAPRSSKQRFTAKKWSAKCPALLRSVSLCPTVPLGALGESQTNQTTTVWAHTPQCTIYPPKDLDGWAGEGGPETKFMKIEIDWLVSSPFMEPNLWYI